MGNRNNTEFLDHVAESRRRLQAQSQPPPWWARLRQLEVNYGQMREALMTAEKTIKLQDAQIRQLQDNMNEVLAKEQIYPEHP
jgi:hypothetical protein